VPGGRRQHETQDRAAGTDTRRRTAPTAHSASVACAKRTWRSRPLPSGPNGSLLQRVVQVALRAGGSRMAPCPRKQPDATGRRLIRLPTPCPLQPPPKQRQPPEPLAPGHPHQHNCEFVRVFGVSPTRMFIRELTDLFADVNPWGTVLCRDYPMPMQNRQPTVGESAAGR
jgi:hypothetical protein